MRTFPNVMYTLDGTTFCLNCLVECLKWPSTLDLHFKSKYFCDFSSRPTEPKKFYEPIVD